MAIAETAARKLLHGGAGVTIAQGVADVGDISFGLWEMVSGFFANILAYLFAALAGAAHLLVLPLEVVWQSLVTIVTAAADAIASGLNGLWQLVTGFFPGVLAALSGVAHEIPQKLEELWRWLQAAAAAALPFALGVAAVILVAALLWFCWPALFAVSVQVGQGLVLSACYFGRGLYYVGVAVHWVFVSLLPPCTQCLQHCAVVTMKAPGVAGTVISRAAFEAAPALFFQISRAAPPIVVATVFCTKTVASLVAAPVAALFRAS